MANDATLACAVWLVPTALGAAAWKDAAPHLASAILRAGGRYLEGDIPACLDSGEMQLFLALGASGPIAAALTSVVTYPSSRRLAILFCGGRQMRRWLTPGLAAIEEWAREQGCDGIEIFGRKGWARALGYRITSYILERSFT